MSDKVLKLRQEHPITDFFAGFIPGVGEALDVHDFYHAAKNKNFGEMGLALIGLGLPIINASLLKKIGKAIINPNKTIKRTLIPVKRKNDVPIYTRELVENGLDTNLLLGKNGKGSSFNNNKGTSDITSGNMNVQGVVINGGSRGAIKFIDKKFAEAPHGQILSFSGNFKDIDQPLSTDSYPLVLNYLSKMEKEGKGMFIPNPYPNKFVLNSAGNRDNVTFYPMLLKSIERVNKKYGKSFKTPELKYKDKKNPGKPGTYIYEYYLEHPEKLIAPHYYEGEPITFIKFKKGGSI